MSHSSKAPSQTRNSSQLLQEARGKTKILISLGDCAVTGNVTALRNALRNSDEAVLERAYIDTAEVNSQIPTEVPKLLKKALPLHEVVKVDYFIPGCPPPRYAHKLRYNRVAQRQNSKHGGKIKVWLKKQRTIVISPITRIEGHAKVTIFLNEDDSVKDARFQVVDFRGFEKFSEGRPFYEMPSITSRSCGICPVSHLLASAKACDDIVGVNTACNSHDAAPPDAYGTDDSIARTELLPSFCP